MKRKYSEEEIDTALDFNHIPQEIGVCMLQAILRLYKEEGWQFSWGQVFECYDPVGECGLGPEIRWEFVLDDMIQLTNKSERTLDEIDEWCQKALEGVADSSWPVEVDLGRPPASFSLVLHVGEGRKNASTEIQDARQWIAGPFLLKILPEIQEFLHSKNSWFPYITPNF